MSYAYDSSLKQAEQRAAERRSDDAFDACLSERQCSGSRAGWSHVFSHQFNLAGPTWFSEPSWKNSGYRSAQAMGLSEHFELLFKVPSSSAPNTNRKCPDGMSHGQLRRLPLQSEHG